MNARRVPVSRRDRPAKPPLSRAGVVAVALEIMRTEGLERVTMRRLAGELDTGPASLYVYVENMAELHGALLDELLAGFAVPGPESAVAVLSSYTRFLMGHPSLARSVLTLRPSGPHYLRLIDTLLRLLHAEGVSPRQAAWGVDLLLQHATATAAEQGTRDESAESSGEQQALAAAIEEAPAGEFPAIDHSRGELLSGTGEQRLHWAFTALIAGIAATPAP